MKRKKKQKTQFNGKGMAKRLVSVACVAALAGSSFCVAKASDGTPSAQGVEGTETGMPDMSGQMPQTDGFSDMLTAEGTTAIRTTEELPAFSASAVRLYIDEVYVEAGDTVSAGDALYKLTDDSYAEAVAYYEEKVAEAEAALETAQLAYETGEAKAQITKSTTELDASAAQESLDAALLELEMSVQEKYEQWQDTLSDIEEYKSNLSSNTYYTDAGIAEKNAAVTEAQTASDTAAAQYETAKAEAESAKSAYESAQSSLQSAVSKLTELTGGDSSSWQLTEIQSAVTALSSAYSSVDSAKAAYEQKNAAAEQASQSAEQATQALQQAKQELERAQEEYEKAYSDAETKLEELQNSTEQLQASYEQAVRDAESQKVQLQNEYDTAVLNGEYADDTYNASVSELEDAVTEAQETLNDLQEAQETLLALGDGTICAASSGTIASVTYSSGNILQSDTALVSYYDTGTIWISLEISQENIAEVSVGDTVQIMLGGTSGGGNGVSGTVYSVASQATEGNSISNVTYTVEVSVDNSDGSISSGVSATVMWNTDAASGGGQFDGQNGGPDGGQTEKSGDVQKEADNQ